MQELNIKNEVLEHLFTSLLHRIVQNKNIGLSSYHLYYIFIALLIIYIIFLTIYIILLILLYYFSI